MCIRDSPITYLIINVGVIALIWIGALKVDAGYLSQGQVVALVNYTAQILVELIKLANMIVMVNKAIACGDRVQEVFEREPGLSTPNEETKPGDGDIAVSFEHVGRCV